MSSGLPPVVKIVLDRLLVLSQDAIDAVVEAAAEPKPSVRTQLKALGWLVADAVGQLPAQRVGTVALRPPSSDRAQGAVGSDGRRDF